MPPRGGRIGQPLRVDDDDVKRLYPVDENRLVSYGTVDTVRLWDRAGNPIGQPLRLPPDPDRYLVADRTVSRIAALLEPGVVQAVRHRHHAACSGHRSDRSSRSGRSSSAAMAGRWPPAASTGQSGSGTPVPARRLASR